MSSLAETFRPVMPVFTADPKAYAYTDSWPGAGAGAVQGAPLGANQTTTTGATMDPQSIFEAAGEGLLPADYNPAGNTWTGNIGDGNGTGADVLSNFTTLGNTVSGILNAVGTVRGTIMNQQTSAYVAKANADATKYQAAAQVAAAQAALKPGAINVQTLMIWIAVAGLVFAAMQVVGKK